MTRILLLGCALLTGQLTGSPQLDARLMADVLASKLRDCPTRAIVAKFKSGWSKTTWGPPTDVDYDVLPTDSLVWPYRIVIQYTLPTRVTKTYKKKDEAEGDSTADLVIRLKYKDMYELGDKGLRISSLLAQEMGGGWHERLTAPDACWDSFQA